MKYSIIENSKILDYTSNIKAEGYDNLKIKILYLNNFNDEKIIH
jgi:hypothetical protein